MDFDFSVVKEGFYRLKLTHFNSSRSISFNQLISISKDLNEHLQEAKNRFEIKTIDKGTIIYYRQALKLSDNDNTVFSDIVNVLKRNGIISTDLPNKFSMHFFADKLDRQYDYIFIIDDKINPFLSMQNELFELIKSENHEGK